MVDWSRTRTYQIFFIARLCSFFDKTINGQSMRAGGATALAEDGVPPSTIQACGRWTSDDFFIYIRKNPTRFLFRWWTQHPLNAVLFFTHPHFFPFLFPTSFLPAPLSSLSLIFSCPFIFPTPPHIVFVPILIKKKKKKLISSFSFRLFIFFTTKKKYYYLFRLFAYSSLHTESSVTRVLSITRILDKLPSGKCLSNQQRSVDFHSTSILELKTVPLTFFLFFFGFENPHHPTQPAKNAQ